MEFKVEYLRLRKKCLTNCSQVISAKVKNILRKSQVQFWEKVKSWDSRKIICLSLKRWYLKRKRVIIITSYCSHFEFSLLLKDACENFVLCVANGLFRDAEDFLELLDFAIIRFCVSIVHPDTYL